MLCSSCVHATPKANHGFGRKIRRALAAEMMTVYDYNEVVERDKLCNTRQLSLRGCGARKGALLGRVLYCVQDILGLAKEAFTVGARRAVSVSLSFPAMDLPFTVVKPKVADTRRSRTNRALQLQACAPVDEQPPRSNALRCQTLQWWC